MNGFVIEASSRSARDMTRAKLRAKQQVPGVVYGHGMEPTPIAVPEKQFAHGGMLGKALVQLKLDGQTMDVMIHALQRHPISRAVLHVDFYKVDLNEPMDIKIPLHVTGIEAVEHKRGIVQQQTREVTIHVLPQSAPEVLNVDVSGLDIGEHLTVGDISLPEGSELKSDPAEVIVSVLAAKRAAADDEAAPADESAAAEQGHTAE